MMDIQRRKQELNDDFKSKTEAMFLQYFDQGKEDNKNGRKELEKTFKDKVRDECVSRLMQGYTGRMTKMAKKLLAPFLGTIVDEAYEMYVMGWEGEDRSDAEAYVRKK